MANSVKTKYQLFDGRKAIDIWNGDEGWTVLSGGELGTEADYYKFIPTLYRAVQLRAYAVSTMPFELMQGDEVYDQSSDWENKVGFLPSPAQLLQLIESALTMCGRAYLFRERSVAMTKKLRYHLPTSVTPKINMDTGVIEYFERPDSKGTKKKYKVDDYVYFWLPDPYVELGPPINYPAQAAANACGVLKGIDVFAAQFFDRGAIKAMLLTVKGMPAESEREKLTEWWKRVVGGIKNAFGAQVINAEAITPVVIGEGIKELENVTIGTEKREDISIAVGIPMSILFANAANYATSQQDELNFLTKTVIPECEFIASVLNEQLFEPLGLHINFLPETLDPMQEDEASRAVALGQLVTAGFDLLTATEILGYELTDEQLARLMAEEQAKQERMDKLAEQLAKKPEEEEQDEDQDTPTSQQASPTAEQGEKRYQDMERWQRKAHNALKRGKSADVPFESVEIPPELCQKIHTSLAGCATEAEVREVFAGAGKVGVVTTPELPFSDDAIKSLTAELKRANDILIATTPPSMIFNMPEQKAGAVNINVPEQKYPNIVVNVPEQKQAPPIVNITNEVNPTAVKVTNQVNPTPINVNIPEQKQQLAPVVNVTNEVNPTPVNVNVTNDVTPAEVNVSNEINLPKPATPEDVRLKVERDSSGRISRVVEE